MTEIVFFVSFALLLYAYIGYPVALFILGQFKKLRSDENPPDSWPSVSILIAAHNEQRVIRERIENLLSLDYPKDKLEIVIVSDASTDATDTIVSDFKSQGVLLIRRTHREGKTAALNIACPMANGEILLFSDANGAFERSAVKTLVAHFSDPRVGCVCGSVRYVDPKNRAAYQGESLYMRYDSWIKTLESRLGSVMGAFGGMFAFRREFFKPMDSMLPVDMEIPLKVLREGFRVIFERSAVCIEPAAGQFVVEFGRHARINARLFYGMVRWVRMLLRPCRPFFLFQFASKKILRWLSPFFFFVVVGMPFVMQGPVFELLRIVSCLFLFAATIGAFLSRLGKSHPLFSFFFHFLIGNLAVAWGFINFLTRRQGPTWSVAREG